MLNNVFFVVDSFLIQYRESVRCARARFCLSSPMKREKCEQRHDSVFNLQPHLAWPVFFSMKFVLPMSMHRLGRCAKFRILRKRHTKVPKNKSSFPFVSHSRHLQWREKNASDMVFKMQMWHGNVFFSSKHSYRAAGCDRSSRMPSIRQQGSVHPDIR